MSIELAVTWCILSVPPLCKAEGSSGEPQTSKPHDDRQATRVATEARKGWALYRNEEYVGAFDNGHYCDLYLDRPGYEFWSDGLIAKLDRDSNGHHETILIVISDKPVYVGKLGLRGTFEHVADKYEKFAGRPVAVSIRDLRRDSSHKE